MYSLRGFGKTIKRKRVSQTFSLCSLIELLEIIQSHFRRIDLKCDLFKKKTYLTSTQFQKSLLKPRIRFHCQKYNILQAM